MTEAKSTSRVAAMRQRRAEQGFVRMEVFVRPKDKEKLREFVCKLNKK
jgi:hypothetical protein